MKESFPKQETETQFPEIASEIENMRKVDQDMREKNLKDQSWDDSIDKQNTARMKEIVAEIGWPTISKVGKESSHSAWLLLQHADHSVEFQTHCLELMKQETLGEVEPRDIAMLEDRIRIHQNQPQLYGTQFRSVNGEHMPLPIEDIEHVDQRRKQMGFPPLQENIANIYKKYGPPDQG